MTRTSLVWRALASLALVVVAAVAVVSVRELAVGRDEIAGADAASDKSDWPEAIAHARAAVEAYLPGSPWPERGFQRLTSVGHDAEARGDDETALLAYGAMRAAALATRGPLSDWERREAQADEGLARVSASRAGEARARDVNDTMLAALRAHELPATGTLLGLALAAVAMLGGLARVAWLGDEARGSRLAPSIAAAGFVVYVVIAWMTA